MTWGKSRTTIAKTGEYSYTWMPVIHVPHVVVKHYSILIKELLNGENICARRPCWKNRHLCKKVLNKGMLLTDVHKETHYQPCCSTRDTWGTRYSKKTKQNSAQTYIRIWLIMSHDNAIIKEDTCRPHRIKEVTLGIFRTVDNTLI